MRYFTPELLMKLNSSDGDMVDVATESWDEALASYQKHLRKLLREMPPEMRPITKLSLHDWNLVTIALSSVDREGGTTLVAVKDNGNLILLSYLLSHKLRRTDSPREWPFTTDRVDWLYDEVDVDEDEPGSFVHRILFSDGTILEIPFSECSVTRVQSDRTMSHSDLMQIA